LGMTSVGFVDHSSSDLDAWALSHLGGARLAHVDRVKRAVSIARAMAAHPGRSLPRLFSTRYDLKAAYTFMQDPRSTPDAIEHGHKALVLQQAAAAQLALLLEDDTVVSFSHRKRRVPGLGSIGRGEAWEQGFTLHTLLAVECPEGYATSAEGKRAPVRVLGIADQQVQTLPWPAPSQGRRPRTKSARLGTERATQIWEFAGTRIGPAPPGARWVRVADREADIYEYLASCRALGHGFRVRAKHNRVLVDAAGGEKLLDRARAAASLGAFTVELRARPGQAPREAELKVSAVRGVIRAPQRPGGAPGKREPIAVWVVRAWEEEGPEGEQGLEWFVLCDEAAEAYETAREVVAQYASRWVIEEFHKGLKTGLGAETLQLEEGHQLFAAVALMSLVALRLLEMREVGRREPEAKAERSGLSELELEVLRVRLGGTIETVREVALAVGRLGGHLNRAGDGMPGWQTLWHGMEELRTLVEGVRLARLLDGRG